MDYDKILNPAVCAIKPSGIRRFFDIAAEMDDVITLGVGEPDFMTPWHIREAGIYSLETGKTFYTANRGLAPLCDEISRYLSRRFGLNYDPKSEVVVTVGGSEAIDIAIRALVSPGDEVLIPEPSFVCYSPITSLAGGVPVPVPTREENDFRLTVDDVKPLITPKTKLLVLPFPNNPTGAVMRKSDLEALAGFLRETDIMILSDEIYGELTYTGEGHVSIASIDGMRERTVLVSGFSKAYAMTGWRLGYACAPAPILKQMLKIHQFCIMCAPTSAQYAAIEALRDGDEDIAHMRESYDMRRKLVVDGLRKLGLPCFEPLGAFYVFPNVSKLGLTSEEFCTRLLHSKKVAVVPGNAFGASGEGFVRISYSYSVNHLVEALERIGAFIAELKK
ncbi:MAG: aminotransferase class I/II-fold pyridoxal phosphate-dependent enzyme [Clostridia bacterium]|nr:aminotransferase class I/II-fold pyridoxal phosphate-dependent enzyme [Clostridia bacterium]